MSTEQLSKILIAGVGNAWLRDDGFGGEVARRLAGIELPPGVAVMDAGTGGLDLAYEVMRGYDALVILDVSRQGGEPGTLYVMEAEEDTVAGGIEDGEVINPHGMDPQTVLRFVKSIGAWPGRVLVIACEPAEIEELGFGLTSRSRRRWSGRSGSWCETVAGTARRACRPGVSGARALALERDREHGHQARRRAAGGRSSASASGGCARSYPTRSSSTSGSSRAAPSARARGSSTR